MLRLPVLLATSVIPTTDAIYTGELLRTTTERALPIPSPMGGLRKPSMLFPVMCRLRVRRQPS
nr:MAG TPA: hypothetical protein [Caudoviricetes sp.]